MSDPTENAREIEGVLTAAFTPEVLRIQDDSAHHAGHAGNVTGGGHYTVTLVSTSFAGLTRVEQHRRVYESLGRRMGTMIHALALRTMTPDEWSRLTD